MYTVYIDKSIAQSSPFYSQTLPSYLQISHPYVLHVC